MDLKFFSVEYSKIMFLMHLPYEFEVVTAFRVTSIYFFHKLSLYMTHHMRSIMVTYDYMSEITPYPFVAHLFGRIKVLQAQRDTALIDFTWTLIQLRGIAPWDLHPESLSYGYEASPRQ